MKNEHMKETWERQEFVYVFKHVGFNVYTCMCTGTQMCPVYVLVQVFVCAWECIHVRLHMCTCVCIGNIAYFYVLQYGDPEQSLEHKKTLLGRRDRLLSLHPDASMFPISTAHCQGVECVSTQEISWLMKKFEVIESKAILPPERYLFFIELP